MEIWSKMTLGEASSRAKVTVTILRPRKKDVVWEGLTEREYRLVVMLCHPRGWVKATSDRNNDEIDRPTKLEWTLIEHPKGEVSIASAVRTAGGMMDEAFESTKGARKEFQRNADHAARKSADARISGSKPGGNYRGGGTGVNL